MKLLRNLSIKNKLTIIIMCVSLFGILSGFTFVIYKDIQTFRDDLIHNTIINAKLMAEYCATPLAFNYNESAEDILQKLQTIPSLSIGIVYDNTGLVFAVYDNMSDITEAQPIPVNKKASYFTIHNLHVFQPIYFENEVFGTIYLRISTQSLEEKIKDYLVTMGLLVLTIMVISYFITIKLQGIFSKPILGLAETTKRISTDTDYSIRVTKPGDDEIGTLYDGFNKMLQQIQQRESELLDKNQIIEDKNRHITDSILYAERIQKAILPLDTRIGDVFSDFFIIYKPKDIISGDFYWFTNKGDSSYLAVVDCTGHGVPGALLSMIGNMLLAEIVLQHDISEPNKILTNLNERLKTVLKQETGSIRTTDGMDIAICKIDYNRKKLEFAGAKRPLCIIRNIEDSNDNIYKSYTPKLIEIKGDRKSIGGRQRKKDKDFTLHEINLFENDIIYLFSDGYADQHNKYGRKIGSMEFKEVLSQISYKEMMDQKEYLLDYIKKHKQDEVQRDDITIVGIKIAADSIGSAAKGALDG